MSDNMNTHTFGNIIDVKFEDNKRILLDDLSEEKEYSFILKERELDYDTKLRKHVVYQKKPRLVGNIVSYDRGTPAQKMVIVKLENKFNVHRKNIIIKPFSEMDV